MFKESYEAIEGKRELEKKREEENEKKEANRVERVDKKKEAWREAMAEVKERYSFAIEVDTILHTYVHAPLHYVEVLRR